MIAKAKAIRKTVTISKARSRVLRKARARTILTEALQKIDDLGISIWLFPDLVPNGVLARHYLVFSARGEEPAAPRIKPEKVRLT